MLFNTALTQLRTEGSIYSIQIIYLKYLQVTTGLILIEFDWLEIWCNKLDFKSINGRYAVAQQEQA